MPRSRRRYYNEIAARIRLRLDARSEEHTSELQSQSNLVCRLLLEKIKSVTSFIQCIKNFTDFTAIVSNYETDDFRPIFDTIEKLIGKKHGSTLPDAYSTVSTEQET